MVAGVVQFVFHLFVVIGHHMHTMGCTGGVMPVC